MKATQQLHDLGQSLWLDNITRDLLDSGTLKRYIDELSVTGLTSNPTIFDQAIKNSSAYDPAIRKRLDAGKSGEALFFELAIEDLTRAADLFRPVHDQTKTVDGWVSLEVSPLLAYDTNSTIAAAKDLSRAGSPAEPVHQDSRNAGRSTRHRRGHLCRRADQCHPAVLARALSRCRRRLSAKASSAASPPDFPPMSVRLHRCSSAAGTWPPIRKCPKRLRDKLGIAISKRTYKAYRDLLKTPRWQAIVKAGYHPQRLLLASTGTKDPKASDILYIKALAAPDTVNTMPEKTLLAFADHGEIDGVMPDDGGDCEQVLAEFIKAGVDIDALAAQLQDEGAKAFVKSWTDLLGVISSKSAVLATGA